jgi:hypothetical protein
MLSECEWKDCAWGCQARNLYAIIQDQIDLYPLVSVRPDVADVDDSHGQIAATAEMGGMA